MMIFSTNKEKMSGLSMINIWYRNQNTEVDLFKCVNIINNYLSCKSQWVKFHHSQVKKFLIYFNI